MTAGDPFGDAKASGFQVIRSPKGAAPQPPPRPTPAPTSRPATAGPITPLDIVHWLREQGITPLPCRPKSKSPIPQISRRGIYGDNAPAGDSFHVPSPERMAAVKAWWSNEDFHRQATVKDCSISVPLHPDWNSGRQVIVLDIDDTSLCDAVANAPALERCVVGVGKKGSKLFAILDPDGGRLESPIVQYAPKDDPDHPALEIFTGSKHALIYGEHPDSTRERPILYAITRGFGEPFPVLTWEEIKQALEPIIREHGLVLKESGGEREPVDLVQAPRPRTRGGRTITDRLGLSITDVCTLTDGVRCGDEIRGSHPVHGSTTGQNFAINPHENTWYCFRCGTGGGPVEWIAVEEEIVDCSEVRPGCLQGHWPEVFAALRARGYEVDEPPSPEEAPDPEITLDVEAEALGVLETGDPLETLRATFATLHSGDREVIDTIAVAVGAQSCVNTQGVQPALTGSKGAGKTAGAKAAVHLIPREYLIEGTFSNKALFYAELKPGMVLFSDDTTLNNEMTDLIKRCMSSFQEETEYRTVDSKLRPRVYTIPPRTVFLFTSLGDQGDDQLNDRQFKIGVEVDDRADAAYEEFLKRKAIEGEQDYPVSRDVLVCRAMIREMKRHIFRVRMPFFNYVGFEDRSNRRIMRYFTDFIAAVAVLRFAQRERSEPDENGVVTLTATVSDMRTAADLFKTNEDTRKLGLTKEELRLWHVIAEHGGEIAENDLIALCGGDGRKRPGTRTHVRRLLYGRTDRGVDEGGLLGKVPGADVRKEIAAVFGKDGETVRRQRNMIVIKARPDISLYSGFYRFDEDAWRRDPEYIPEAV
ncbi:hypothetical protein [Methanoculleus sp.]|uniref:hypothetical protein n=1 Tax=Methanoculleus sp. TaxID=90427 RepID=UPI0025F7D4B7|nr:hypothetical protein [Methanoculleus sp.]